MTKRNAGVTLIELMIVVALIGILASIAYPSFQEQVRKTRRADATGALMGLAAALEREYTSNGDYCDAGGAGGGNVCGDGGNDTGTPSVYSGVSPVDGGTVAYNLTISAMNAAGTTFTLRATPTGPQTDDICGFLELDNTGARDMESSTLAVCWE